MALFSALVACDSERVTVTFHGVFLIAIYLVYLQCCLLVSCMAGVA